MGDIDNIKDKLLNYQSPLDIEKEWGELTLKKENVTLKKELRTRNIIGGVLGVGLLILGGIWVITSMNVNWNKNTVNNTKLDNPAIALEETPALEEKINLDEALINQEISSSNDKQTLEETSELKKTSTLNQTSVLKKTPVSTKNKTNSKSKKELSESDVHIHVATNTKFDSNSGFDNSEKQKITPQKAQKNKKLPFKNTQPTKNAAQKTRPDASIFTTKPTPLIQTNKQYKTVAELSTKQFVLIDKQTNTDLLLTASPAPPKYKLRDGKNFVGLELLGQGGYYSLNYGRVLSRQRFGETDIQLGVSRNPRYVSGLPNIHILMGSISIHQSFRVYRPHHLTIGLAAVFGHRTTDADTASNSYYNLGVIVPKIGYRYHAPKSRISYKAELIIHNNFSYTSAGENTEIPPRIFPNKGNVWGGLGIFYHF